MAELHITIPDELDARLRSYLADHGEDLAAFTANAIDAQLHVDEDPELYSELLAKTRIANTEIEEGKGMDAATLKRHLAAETGIPFDR